MSYQDQHGPAVHRCFIESMSYASFYPIGFCPQCCRRMDGMSAEPGWDEDYCASCLTVWWPPGTVPVPDRG